MNIVVLGGSPKGTQSVTMQYVEFLKKASPDADWTVIQVANRARAITEKKELQDEIREAVGKADLVLWAFPLYFMTVHGNYKRFIEWASGHIADLFRGKYAASLSTSIHFYDHIAHNYIHALCEDLGMKFIGGYSPKMNDLLCHEGREQARAFVSELFTAVRSGRIPARHYGPLPSKAGRYTPGLADAINTKGRRVVIIHDECEANTVAMAKAAAALCGGRAECCTLSDMQMKGGCFGCLKCGDRNICAWEGKDGYVDFYKSKIMTADILVFCISVRNRHLQWEWQQVWDRSFFNTHQPNLTGKRLVFLLSGFVRGNENFLETLKAYTEFQEAELAALISDECQNSTGLDTCIRDGLVRAVELSQAGAKPVQSFRGIAGMKVFRDDISEGLKIIFRGDHRVYKKRKYYRKGTASRLHDLFTWLAYQLTSLPFIRKGMYSGMTGYMTKPYERYVKAAPAQKN